MPAVRITTNWPEDEICKVASPTSLAGKIRKPKRGYLGRENLRTHVGLCGL